MASFDKDLLYSTLPTAYLILLRL